MEIKDIDKKIHDVVETITLFYAVEFLKRFIYVFRGGKGILKLSLSTIL
ncbi:hypothetical protein ES703_52504 [subsurface metagenome]